MMTFAFEQVAKFLGRCMKGEKLTLLPEDRAEAFRERREGKRGS
jgi:hypothetical protein